DFLHLYLAESERARESCRIYLARHRRTVSGVPYARIYAPTQPMERRGTEMNLSATDQQLSSYVEQRSARLIEILQDLVRIPSENTPPQGSEGECQKYIAGFLSKLGCDPV